MTGTKASASESVLTTDMNELESLAQKVDEATSAVQSMPTELRIKALALKSAIEAFHKAGLIQIVRRLKADPRGKELLMELVNEPEVYALFLMHGLVKADLALRVARVVEMVRPYMQSHGGDVAFVALRDRTVLVRLLGSCSGCSMSQVTLKNTVEEALKQEIPEIEGVEVVSEDGDNDLVQIQIKSDIGTAGWVEGPFVDDLPLDRPYAFTARGVPVLLVRCAQGLRAYRNVCSHQGLPLDGGVLDVEAGVLTCPWHGFSFDAESGECLTAPQCQLEAFPLRMEDGRVWVRPE